MKFHLIPEILEDIKQGKIIILLDDEREHEGDMIVAAEFATPENIGFMMKYGCGIICMPITVELATKFKLELFPRRNCDDLNDCFNTISVDARGVGGISAYDRSKSIMTIISDESTENDIKTPGHLFPLLAKQGGVLERAGHTEASVDLAILAGLKPAAALVEVMNLEKDMPANNRELFDFASEHQIKISTIKELIKYRESLL
jgi:3,4-dihydroxy 2-butanone 4-phosphate synthase/GTP cyclohydrolase II